MTKTTAIHYKASDDLVRLSPANIAARVFARVEFDNLGIPKTARLVFSLDFDLTFRLDRHHSGSVKLSTETPPAMHTPRSTQMFAAAVELAGRIQRAMIASPGDAFDAFVEIKKSAYADAVGAIRRGEFCQFRNGPRQP